MIIRDIEEKLEIPPDKIIKAEDLINNEWLDDEYDEEYNEMYNEGNKNG